MFKPAADRDEIRNILSAAGLPLPNQFYTSRTTYTVQFWLVNNDESLAKRQRKIFDRTKAATEALRAAGLYAIQSGIGAIDVVREQFDVVLD